MICFQLYESRDPSLHNTANVAIRQVVQTKFDRLNVLANSGTCICCVGVSIWLCLYV